MVNDYWYIQVIAKISQREEKEGAQEQTQEAKSVSRSVKDGGVCCKVE